MNIVTPFTNTSIGVGFGTAALGGNGHTVCTWALEAGFRKFDTAEENEYWYDQHSLGTALRDFFASVSSTELEECNDMPTQVCSLTTCQSADVRVSTKIPPWSLTSAENIRSNAARSREELLGFCQDQVFRDEGGQLIRAPFPLDVYYIHAPSCWKGWHPQCDHAPPLLNLKEAWQAMEAVVGLDYSARRIGLSNIQPNELLDIIQFVRKRQESGQTNPPPRIPDAVQIYADPIEPAEEMLRICREHGIEFVSYSTLGTQHRSGRGNPVLGSPVVKRIAQKHARSTAEVVLSWALQKGMSVIPRSTKKRHIQELARLLAEEDPTFLDKDDMKDIDAMKHSA